MTDFTKTWDNMTIRERIAHLLADWRQSKDTTDPMVLRVAATMAHHQLEEADEEIRQLRDKLNDAMNEIRWLKRNQIRFDTGIVPPPDAEGTRWARFIAETSFSVQFLRDAGRDEAKRYLETNDGIRRSLSAAVDRHWDEIMALAIDGDGQ